MQDLLRLADRDLADAQGRVFATRSMISLSIRIRLVEADLPDATLSAAEAPSMERTSY